MKYNPIKKLSHNRGFPLPKYMEVWLAEIPFDNTPDKKKRPCIVVGHNDGKYNVVMITSSGLFSQKDFKIVDTEYAGLDHDSTARPEKIYSITASKFDHKLGDLCDFDREELLSRIHQSFKVPF